MPDPLTTSQRSDLMRRVRSTGTKPEQELRAALETAGASFESNAKDLPGKPDIVFRKNKLACFVDGDFWHGGQWRRRSHHALEDQFPIKKRAYWLKKVHSNIQRDITATGALLGSGWTVLRLWESDVHADPAAAADLVLRARDRRAPISRFSAAGLGVSADFFAGIGLMSMGLHAAGWRTIWANDYDATKRRLYLHNRHDHPIELEAQSIHDVSPKRVPRVGLMAACFPCTDLSLAGVGRGLELGPQSSAFLRFADILGAMGARRPPFVILENVLGLIHSENGRDFNTVLSRLAECGYTVDAVVVDARHFVPQSRPRLFILGVRKEIDIAPTITPADIPEDDPLRPERLASFMRSHPKLPWSIRPLPSLPNLSADVASILDDIPDDDRAWWSDERVAKLKRQVSDRHLAMIRKRLHADARVVATAFRRMRKGRSMAELRFDGLAGCLRTPKGGSAKQIVVIIDKKRWRARLLTPRECARLMGAPDFRMDAEGIRNDDVLFGFGDAVCVPAVEWLVRNYINPLAAELIRGEPLAVK